MPVARTRSVALLGLTGSIVEVEADLSAQLPAFIIIGLPEPRVFVDPRRRRPSKARSACVGVEGGRGAWRYWRRNAALAWCVNGDAVEQ